MIRGRRGRGAFRKASDPTQRAATFVFVLCGSGGLNRVRKGEGEGGTGCLDSVSDTTSRFPYLTGLQFKIERCRFFVNYFNLPFSDLFLLFFRPLMKPVPFLLIMASALMLGTPLGAVVTLEDADSFWKFDGGTVGSAATNTQIVDSSLNSATHPVSSSANLSWVAGPAGGNYGGIAQGVGGHALKFNPVVTTQVAGSGADTVAAATFLATNASVSGSSTMITRLRWDGQIPLQAGGGFIDDNTNQWIVANGFGGWNESILGSLGYMFGLTTTGGLYYYTAAANASNDPPQTPSGASHSFQPSGFTFTEGQWYDVAMVLDDFGDASKTTGQVTFYVVGPNGEVQTFISGTNVWISPTSNANLLVGSESAGTGSVNQRKAFNGAMDYLALFDTALTRDEVLAIFAIPEPSRALLLLTGLSTLAMRRRRLQQR
jgi:hypothetical protein